MNKIKKIVLSVLASGFAFVTAATCNGPAGFDFYRDDDANVYDVIVVDTVPVYVDTYPVYIVDDCYKIYCSENRWACPADEHQ